MEKTLSSLPFFGVSMLLLPSRCLSQINQIHHHHLMLSELQHLSLSLSLFLSLSLSSKLRDAGLCWEKLVDTCAAYFTPPTNEECLPLPIREIHQSEEVVIIHHISPSPLLLLYTLFLPISGTTLAGKRPCWHTRTHSLIREKKIY